MRQIVNSSSLNLKKFSAVTKRGVCIYIADVVVIARVLEFVYGIIERRRKVSSREATQMMNEVASYIYFATINQILAYGEANLPESDVRRILDVVATCFCHSYHIDNRLQRLGQYVGAHDPTVLVSGNIAEIVGKEGVDFMKQVGISAFIRGMTKGAIVEGVVHMFEFSDEDMDRTIERFLVKYYPHLLQNH